MAGFAPFGRDDQPLLDVKIVGGRRVEIAVDHYGKPLKGDNRTKLESESRFSRSLSDEHNAQNSKGNSSVPPWIRGETPPKKILKPLEISPASTQQSSRTGSRDSKSSGISGSSMVLPPISTQKPPQYDNKDYFNDSNSLLQDLKIQLHGFDIAKLKDAYLHLTSLDSTLTGFVDIEQVAQAFTRCSVPITGQHFDALTSKFMSARRPNWINYEQMLKYINKIVGSEGKIGKYPILSHNPYSSDPGPMQWKSTGDQEITLKPNQISPRSINDGSITGRQSKMLVNHAFQDRQDAHLLIEMERLLKQVKNIKELIWNLQETLNDSDQNNTGNKIIYTQKVKSICLRHHLPFNGSLLDRILDRFDPRGTGKVDWTEFMAFVERAMPLHTASSHESSCSQSRDNSVETPPSRPSWETRQPLQVLSKRQRVIPEVAALDQEEMYNSQKKILDQHLNEQNQQLSEILYKQQQDLDKRQQALQTDHIADYGYTNRDLDGRVPHQSGRGTSREQQELEEEQRKLLQQQYELMEQKRKISQEQGELEKFVRHGGGASAEITQESHVKSFLRLAHALFLYDSKGSGFLEEDVTRRLVTNYNLVYGLDFSSDIIEDAVDSSSTGDGMVSVDRLLDGLKKHL